MGVGCPCPPVCNNIVTPHQLFLLLLLQKPNILGKKKKKANYLFVSVSNSNNEKNIAKSMIILKICERFFK